MNLAHDLFALIQQVKLYFISFKREGVKLFKSNKLPELRGLNYAVIERNSLVRNDCLEFVEMLILKNKHGDEDEDDAENGEIIERSYRTQTNETVINQDAVERPSEIFIEDESLHLGEKPSSERSKFISSISERFNEQDLLLEKIDGKNYMDVPQNVIYQSDIPSFREIDLDLPENINERGI